MKIAKIISAGAAAVALIGSGALAQQSLSGSITKVDEANGKITIQQTQSGTVGANTSGAAEDFKVQDGLVQRCAGRRQGGLYRHRNRGREDDHEA
jgi:Cu/Ag efflux protein CusF